MKGFKLQEKGVIFRVSFNWWNEKVVQCILKVEHQNSPVKCILEFKAKAYCNHEAGDKFSLEEGQRISFTKAMKKYIRINEKIAMDFSNLLFQSENSFVILLDKLDNIWNGRKK